MAAAKSYGIFGYQGSDKGIKMTLAKAVEALKFYRANDIHILENCTAENDVANRNYLRGSIAAYGVALASLPEPMTEEEILEIIMTANEWNDGGVVLPDNARKIIRALRDAGVLYVMEGK